MPVQTARRANLHDVIRLLEEEGFVTREAQVVYLGRPVTPYKLQAMLDGAHIDTLFAEHVEFVLFKPRGWLSTHHGPPQAAPPEAVGRGMGREA